MSLSLYSLTSKEFIDLAFFSLGKGKRHAMLYYKSLLRDIPLKGVEENSASLLKEISELTNSKIPPISKVTHEGEIKKFLLKLDDGLETESVIIPMKSKTTLCVSSQVGCNMGCRFCETGKMGRIRSLKREEIVFQWIAAKSISFKVDNIVFMGMGEPMDNLDEVCGALSILTDPQGISLSPSRITVSTSGIVPEMRRFYELSPRGVQLAVSVNAPSDEIRNKIMPVNRKWNMQALYDAMKEYCERLDHTILVEYVMLDGINDRREDALLLKEYLQGLKVKVNLIPYNAQSNAVYKPSTQEAIDAFAKLLRESGLQVLLRHSKGRSLMAACGQLGNVELKKSLLRLRRGLEEAEQSL